MLDGVRFDPAFVLGVVGFCPRVGEVVVVLECVLAQDIQVEQV